MKVIISLIITLIFSQCTENITKKINNEAVEIIEDIPEKNNKIGEIVANFEIGSKTIIPKNTIILIEDIMFNVSGINLIDSTLVECSLEMKPTKSGKLTTFPIASKIFDAFSNKHGIQFTPQPHNDPAVSMQTAYKTTNAGIINFISITEQYNQIGVAEGVYLAFSVSNESLMAIYNEENPIPDKVK